MSQKEVTIRHNLIMQKLRKGPASRKSINDYLASESDDSDYNLCMDKRTFSRDLESILSIYKILISWDRSRKVYFIEDSGKSEMNERNFAAFDTLHAINKYENTAKYIHLEKRRPLGTENLSGLLKALKNQYRVKFFYQKFYKDTISEISVDPLALKEFKNRWYLIVRDMHDKEKIKSFALDRLSDLTITNKKVSSDLPFDLDEHYRHCFGIMSPNEDAPHEIILSFDAFQGNYIKSLPLHTSQEILIDTKEELRIKLTLYTTFDLITELLSYGDRMKVLGPEVLIAQIRSIHENAAKR